MVLLLLLLSAAPADVADRAFLGTVEKKLEARRGTACGKALTETAIACAQPYDRAVRHVALLKLVLGGELSGELSSVEQFAIGAAMESYKESDFAQFSSLVKPAVSAAEWSRLVKLMEAAKTVHHVEMRGCCKP